MVNTLSTLFYNVVAQSLAKDISTVDCYEIANCYYRQSNDGCILVLKPRVPEKWFDILEYGIVENVRYHVVYMSNRYVLDPRFFNYPVSLEEYLDAVAHMNHIDIEYTIIEREFDGYDVP